MVPQESSHVRLRTLAHYQKQDAHLQQMTKSSPALTRKIFRGGEELICFIICPANTRIFVLIASHRRTVEWHHTYLLHPKKNRIETTIPQYL